MEEILRQILDELKWHSRQNDKIIELLGKQKKPCGQAAGIDMMKFFESLPNNVKSNPMFSQFLSQMKEAKNNGH